MNGAQVQQKDKVMGVELVKEGRYCQLGRRMNMNVDVAGRTAAVAASARIFLMRCFWKWSCAPGHRGVSLRGTRRCKRGRERGRRM